jgi:phospholipid transport system transporter-binding protein
LNAVPAEPRADVDVVDLGSGRIQIRGALIFATARRARAAGAKLLLERGGPTLEVDCSAVSASDSAGLAVLLDWMALANRQGRAVHFTNLPAPIRAVAHISDVESILSQGLSA